MPLPSRKKGETRQNYVSRCVSFMTRNNEGKDNAQRVAICNTRADINLSDEQIDALAKLITNLAPPMKKKKKDKYRITKEDGSGTDNTAAECLPCQASLPDSFYGTTELFATASENKKPPRPLGKPFRTPGGPKKFSVYVKNERGNIVKVNFGDPNMEIKRDDPGRRKNFRARHNCDSPGPKWKARYWSCRFWERGAPVGKLTSSERAEALQKGRPSPNDPRKTPAEPEERRRGSKKNKPGSAEKPNEAIKTSESTESAIRARLEKHNKSGKGSKATMGMLKTVYRRGAGAFSTSHHPKMSRHGWAMARIAAFLFLLKNGRPSNPNYTQDNDLLPKGHPRSSK